MLDFRTTLRTNIGLTRSAHLMLDTDAIDMMKIYTNVVHIGLDERTTKIYRNGHSLQNKSNS